YEDVWHYLWAERRLPVNLDPFTADLRDEEDRARLARVLEQGLGQVVGFVLPLAAEPGGASEPPRWRSGPWVLGTDHLSLVPGASPIGLRLPLDSLPWTAPEDERHAYEPDPFSDRPPLMQRQAHVRSETRKGDGSLFRVAPMSHDRQGSQK